jgi:mannose-6-phosphate isomerase-like protein (cupin superfamily)
MHLQGKVWGNTQAIFQKPNFEIHRIEIEKGGFCSTHKHNNKFNAFYMESGTLKILIEQKDYNLVDETILTKGGLSIVKPGLYHSFEALTDCVCYEIYWTELNHDDIERRTVGGAK